jgi:hypothetical protein
MKSERFKRTKSVMATSVIALVVAALTVGASHLVVGSRSASPQHIGFELASSPSTFIITSNIYPSPACSGSAASLNPGVTRCAVFTVQNLLNVPVTVQSITTTLDGSFPAPPTQCAPPTYFTLPTFSGSATVGANATVNLPGVPIELIDSGSNQDACKNLQYHFAYSGGAQYTDSTTTSLASSQNPSTSGQPVSFTAAVTASNPSTDGGTPTSGTVTFYSCPTAACASTTQLGTGSVGSNGQATYATTTLPVGADYIQAVYGGTGTNFTGSSSNVVTQTVNSGTLGTTSVLTSAPNPSTYGSSLTFTDTVSASSGTPGGTVTFYSCTTSACSTKTSFGTGTLNSSGKATYSTSSLPAGTTYVEAVYGASGNYGGSTSNVVSQKVNKAATSLVLTASSNPSHFGQAITLIAQTTPGTGPTGTVSFYQDAPPNGFLIDTATLNASGKATLVTKALPPGTYSIYAVYSGDANFASSQSNTVTLAVGYSSSCLTGTITGGYTVTSGQSICISGKVTGGVSVQSGGALFLNGANVSGAITSNGAAAIRFCGSTISGNVTVSGTTGFVMIGDGDDDGTPACADNTITGTVTISSNSGGIEVGGNTINGTLSVSGNTGGTDPEIEGNHISGSLSCATSNNPALDNGGQRNTVGGSRTGQCSAGSF